MWYAITHDVPNGRLLLRAEGLPPAGLVLTAALAKHLGAELIEQASVLKRRHQVHLVGRGQAAETEKGG